MTLPVSTSALSAPIRHNVRAILHGLLRSIWRATASSASNMTCACGASARSRRLISDAKAVAHDPRVLDHFFATTQSDQGIDEEGRTGDTGHRDGKRRDKGQE
nr:hypothetical protein [Pandoravirus aubagnensis]